MYEDDFLEMQYEYLNGEYDPDDFDDYDYDDDECLEHCSSWDGGECDC